MTDKLQYQIKQNSETEKFYVILWNDDRIVTDFGDYDSAEDAKRGADADSHERQDCAAPIKGEQS